MSLELTGKKLTLSRLKTVRGHLDGIIQMLESEAAADEAEATEKGQLLRTTILSLPGISSPTCKAAIEGTVAPIVGVGAVEVNVPAKTVTIHHDHRAPIGRLIEAIEDQGYHIASNA